MTLEGLRQRVRGILGYRSWPYRTASSVISTTSLAWREGLRTTLQVRRLRKPLRTDGEVVSIKLRTLHHPIFVRPGSRDGEMLVRNIVRDEYGKLDLDRYAPHFIVDAGAYIGDTAAFFLSKYPKATLVALEPNPISFAVAQRNLAPYGNRARLLAKALSDRPTALRLSGVETGARVSDAGDVEVEATTMADLLELSPSGRVSILKLDIEGAERELFLRAPGRWLSRVDHIIVETHGPEIEEVVLGALRQAGWQATRFRNLYYCSSQVV